MPFERQAERYLRDSVRAADVAGINADFIDSRRGGFHRETPVEMDIGDERYRYLAFYRVDKPHGVHIRHSDAQYLAARALEALCLRDVRRRVVSRRAQHRLHRYRIPAADKHIADAHGFCNPAQFISFLFSGLRR
jgi:hypothetical protein